MGRFPKQVTLTNADPELWPQGLVQLNIVAIVPESHVRDILNQIGQVL